MAKLNVEVLDMVGGKITKIAYEGAEYAKVDGKAEVGDIVVNNRGHKDLTIGGYYSVLKVYDTERVRVADDVSDGHDIRKSLIYGPFRKISAAKPTLEQRVKSLESDVAAMKGEKIAEETIEFEGATYRKVDREAREGDAVIFRKNNSCIAKNGKAYKVLAPDDESSRVRFIGEEYGDFNVYEIGFRRTRETVDVYEPIEYVPQEGDIVVVESLDNDVSVNAMNVKVGDIGKVGKKGWINENCSQIIVPGRKQRSNYVDLSEVRKATPAEVEKYEQAMKDAEIAEKWSQIVRKPNEFKKGDVVRVVDNMCTSAISIGDLAIVNYQVKESGSLDVSVPSGGTRYVRGELIAPVESLFNNA